MYLPDPITPMKSATMDKAPMHIPPKAAAIGMSLFNSLLVPCSVNPLYCNCYSLNYLATSLTPCPETSIQVLEKIPQVPIMNTM